MKNIILIGPPGAGKGTQAKLLSERLGLIHISTGDLIREEQANDTKIGKLANQLIDKGQFLPDNIVITMVKQKVINNSNAAGFIFDGFPRTVDQAKSLDEFLNARKTPINKVILLDINDEVVKKRISERALVENRVDDNAEVLQTRIDVYKKQTMPVINYYKNSYLFAAARGVVNIEASKSREAVTEDLVSAI
jgi:adenylate kinase